MGINSMLTCNQAECYNPNLPISIVAQCSHFLCFSSSGFSFSWLCKFRKKFPRDVFWKTLLLKNLAAVVTQIHLKDGFLTSDTKLLSCSCLVIQLTTWKKRAFNKGSGDHQSQYLLKWKAKLTFQFLVGLGKRCRGCFYFILFLCFGGCICVPRILHQLEPESKSLVLNLVLLPCIYLCVEGKNIEDNYIFTVIMACVIVKSNILILSHAITSLLLKIWILNILAFLPGMLVFHEQGLFGKRAIQNVPPYLLFEDILSKMSLTTILPPPKCIDCKFWGCNATMQIRRQMVYLCTYVAYDWWMVAAWEYYNLVESFYLTFIFIYKVCTLPFLPNQDH